MSDLHCPATLLVCRHGDAVGDGGLSDDDRRLSERGAEQVRELAESLRSRKVARVYTSTEAPAVESGALAARLLGVDSVELQGLQELSGRLHDDPEPASVHESWPHGDLGRSTPGGETRVQVVERFREALQGIADLHRGETVLVFTHGGVMSLVLPQLAASLPAGVGTAKAVPHCAVAEVSVDADGFDLLSWPGSADRTVV